MSATEARRRGARRTFSSTADYFAFVVAFVEGLRAKGHDRAASDLLEGYRCLNGLTDGWALFLEAAQRVETRDGPSLDSRDRADLGAIRAVAWKAVYRR